MSTTLPTATRYGFYDRLSATFPSQVVMDTTEVCNLACIHCPHPEFKRSHHYAGRMLDFDLARKAIDEVRERGRGVTQYIRFTGEGEPLIHPRIMDILAYAVQHAATTVTLTTNGTLLDERRVEALLATGVDLVDISIDAHTPETYSKVRVKGNLEVTRANVLRLIGASKGTRTRVIVSYVEQPQNRHESQEFERFWRAQGAQFVVIRRLHSNAGAVSGIARSLEEVAADRRPCLYPWERIILNPRGHLAFCPVDWVEGSVLGDYRETTIQETWQGEAYQALREAHLRSAYEKHAFCGACPDWKLTQWPDQGRSYANIVEDFKAKE